MILYLIQDRNTGKWWDDNCDVWRANQEHATIYTYESDATMEMKEVKRMRPMAKPVKHRFRMIPYSEMDGEAQTMECASRLWTFNHDMDAWLCGDQENGCGVRESTLPGNWTGNVVNNGEITMLSNYSSLQRAMEAAVKLFEEQQNECR